MKRFFWNFITYGVVFLPIFFVSADPNLPPLLRFAINYKNERSTIKKNTHIKDKPLPENKVRNIPMKEKKANDNFTKLVESENLTSLEKENKENKEHKGAKNNKDLDSELNQKSLFLPVIDGINKVLENLKTTFSLPKKIAFCRANILSDQPIESSRSVLDREIENHSIDNQNNFPPNERKLISELRNSKGKINNLVSKPSKYSNKKILQLEVSDLRELNIREGYAIGVALGSEILELQKTQTVSGEIIDKKYILSGIVDAFFNKILLNKKDLMKTLAEINESSSNKSHLETNSANLTKPFPVLVKPKVRKEDLGFFDAYLRRRNVHKSPYGFWYDIVSLGKNSLKPSDTVGIVVEESLTNGTVINDMKKNNRMLKRKLSEYPFLLQEALKKLRSYGEMNMVVPYQLAYGKKGKPPEIPPESMMVYHISIVYVSSGLP